MRTRPVSETRRFSGDISSLLTAPTDTGQGHPGGGGRRRGHGTAIRVQARGFEPSEEPGLLGQDAHERRAVGGEAGERLEYRHEGHLAHSVAGESGLDSQVVLRDHPALVQPGQAFRRAQPREPLLGSRAQLQLERRYALLRAARATPRPRRRCS